MSEDQQEAGRRAGEEGDQQRLDHPRAEVDADHGGSLDVALVGLVVLRQGANIDAPQLLEWANAKLGKNQRLAAIQLRESLPRSPIGKVLKRELREPYWTKAKA